MDDPPVTINKQRKSPRVTEKHGNSDPILGKLTQNLVVSINV